MSLTTNRWHYFFAYEDPKQEVWLEDQARSGLHLVRPGLFRFTFAQGEPRDEKYRLDFQMLRGAAREEYLGLFRDTGWEFLGQVANRYYFRARLDASSPEIFSDLESRRDRIRRQMRVCGVVTGFLVFQTLMGVVRLLDRSSSGPPVLTIGLAGVFACLGMWCLWQMQQAYRRER